VCGRTADAAAVAPCVKKGGVNTCISTWCGKSLGHDSLCAYHTVKQVGRWRDSTSTQAYAECRDRKEALSLKIIGLDM